MGPAAGGPTVVAHEGPTAGTCTGPGATTGPGVTTGLGVFMGPAVTMGPAVVAHGGPTIVDHEGPTTCGSCCPGSRYCRSHRCHSEGSHHRHPAGCHRGGSHRCHLHGSHCHHDSCQRHHPGGVPSPPQVPPPLRVPPLSPTVLPSRSGGSCRCRGGGDTTRHDKVGWLAGWHPAGATAYLWVTRLQALWGHPHASGVSPTIWGGCQRCHLHILPPKTVDPGLITRGSVSSGGGFRVSL